MATKVNGLIQKVNPGNNTEYSIASTAYGYCETAAATAAKVVDMTGFTLLEGTTIHIKFKNNNTAASPTLNVNGTGAKPIVQYGTTAASTGDATTGWYAGAVVSFTYDGTSWVRDQGFNTNTTYPNAIQVYNRTSIGTSPNFDDPGVNGLFEIRNSTETTGESGVKPFNGYGAFFSAKTPDNVAMLQLAGNSSDGWYIRGKQSSNVTLSGVTWNRLVTNSGTWAISITGNAATATKATQDSDGNAINTTYIKKSTLSGAYDIMYSSAANTPTRLAANTTTTKKFLRMTGTGSAGTAPVWDTVTKSDVGLGNVENTKLSTWAGSSNITTIGTLSSGTVPWARLSNVPAGASKEGTVTSITPGNGLLNGTGTNAITTSGTLNINYGTTTAKIGTTAAGSATTVSRSDHVHAIDLATGDNNGQVKIAGTNVSVKGLENGYLNIHPENTPILIPFIHNDIAHLLKRGGSISATYDGNNVSYDFTNAFDGSGSYVSVSSTTYSTLILTINLHKTFTWTNTIYVDFGSVSWRAKSIKIEAMNSNYADDTWTQKYNTTTNGAGHVSVITSHTPSGASNASGGFNKIRFTFSDFNSTDRRIAQLGIYNYGSVGLRETYMSRGVDDYVFRNITPNANNTYSLGDTNHKWANIYATTFYGNLSGNAETSSAVKDYNNNTLTKFGYSTTGMTSASWLGGWDASVSGEYRLRAISPANAIKSGIGTTAIGKASLPVYWNGSEFTTITSYEGKAATAGAADTATKATQDGSGNTITSTYVKKAGDTMTGGLNIKPASGEGGELHLCASTANTNQAGIILDQLNSTFRIFGIPSADGTTKTGTGTPLVIDPYAKTITGGYTLTGNLSGNASTATKFASNQSVALTGDVTGSASSQAGWSIATTLVDSGVTANTYGNTSQQTPSHGGTFNIPYFKVDAKGRVTQAGTTTVKLPADSNTDTKVTQNNATAANDYRILLSASANDTAETNTVNKSTNLRYNPSTNTLSTGNITGTGNLDITGNANLNGETYITSANAGSLLVSGNANFVQIPTAPTPDASSNDTSVATTAFVTSALTGVSSPMRFIGSLGTGGTATSLPAASAANQGYTYKVITANTYQGVAAKVGDVLVSNGSSWILIPSGDEPSGTVTSITLKAGNGITLDTDNTAITSSGTRTISHKDTSSVSNLTANGRTYVTGLTFDTYGHVTAYTTGTETVTNSDTKNTAGSTDTTSKIFLIGATSQAANPQTYSDSEIYVQNGTLYAVKAQDLSGTVNNKPALIVGGTDTAAHMELDSNEIQAKTNGTSVAQLYINNDGGLVTVGSGGLAITSLTASQAVSTDANKKLVSTNLTVSDPTASGTGITYIATISQGATGKITATKSTVRSASTSQTGVTQYTADNLNTWINQLGTGSSTPTDADYYISQYVGGGTTTTTYHRRPMSALWEYVKGKITAGTYWANIKISDAAKYNAAPEMATLKLNGNTSATAASTSNVTLVYDTTSQALNFVFA